MPVCARSGPSSSWALCRLQQLLLAWDYFDLDERLTNEQGALQQELKAVPATFNDMQVSLHATPCSAADAGSRQRCLHSGPCLQDLPAQRAVEQHVEGSDASPHMSSLQLHRLWPIQL